MNTSNTKKTELFGSLTPSQSSGLVFTLVSVSAVVLSFAFLIVITLAGLTADEDFATKDWYLYCSFLLTPLAFCVSGVWVSLRTGRKCRQEAVSLKCSPKYFLLALSLQTGLLCLSQLNELFLEFLGKFGYVDSSITLPSMDGFGFVGVLLAVAVVPAIFEEWIFRGLLLRGMRPFGTVGAVLIGGALFSLYHQNPAQTPYQFCCGAAFTLLTIRSGSILPTMLSHFINNALILLLTKLDVVTIPTPLFLALLLLSVACLLFSLWWLIVKEKRTLAPVTDAKERRSGRRGFFLYAAVGVALCALTWLVVLFTGM